MRRVVPLASFFLVVVGALNWLLVGTAKFDLVRRLLGRNTVPSRIVYDAVGAAGLYQLLTYVLSTTRGRMYPATR